MGKKRLLCVDDHEDTCALVSSILSDFEVISEHTKAGGLGRAMTGGYDVILADYYLPDGTGLELCGLVRTFDPHTPILLVTATHTIEHEQVIAVGGQGVMRKDHLTQLLPTAVASALEARLHQKRTARQ
ncbi:MAG TPA: response regulator [Pyrinomonadaceae bacterium]|nr:response regulator [Pyrinomonadaceae bacterium]